MAVHSHPTLVASGVRLATAVVAQVAQLSQAMQPLQTTVQSMAPSDEDVVFTETFMDNSSGEVTVVQHKYNPAYILALSKDRMAVCKGCENLTKVKTCSLCNCFMPAKVAIPFASCPDGKWAIEE